MERARQAADWERDGFLTGIQVCGREEAGRVRSEFDALEAGEGREKAQIGLLDRHLDQRFVWDLATHPAILDAVEAVMGPDILLLATHFFCKYPASPELAERERRSDRENEGRGDRGAHGGDASAVSPTLRPSIISPSPPRFVAWHQDVTYWGLEPPFALTAWYAVDDSDVENGCMRVIPGTHAGLREHGTAVREGNLLSINQEVPVTPEEEARAVDLCLRAGEISLHHGMLIHGSNPNHSSRRRCGLTIRYVPPHVRVTGENSQKRPWQPILLRGRDEYGYLELREAPYPLAAGG